MKNIAASLIAAVVLIASAPAFAQTPAVPASAQATPDPAAAQAVRELLDTMQYKDVTAKALKQMSQTMPAMFRQMSNASISRDPKLSPEQQKVALAKAEKGIPEAMIAMDALFSDPTLIDEMGAAVIPIYTRYFTIDEIHQLTVFYKSGAGVKMLAVMPQLMSESMQVGQQIMIPRINKLIEKFSPEAAK